MDIRVCGGQNTDCLLYTSGRYRFLSENMNTLFSAVVAGFRPCLLYTSILAFDDEQLLPTHQTPGPALVQVVDGTAYFTIGNAEADLSQGRCV